MTDENDAPREAVEWTADDDDGPGFARDECEECAGLGFWLLEDHDDEHTVTCGWCEGTGLKLEKRESAAREAAEADELGEAMLDAISNHANVCLARASNASLMADRAEDREQRGRLSAESERWREAYQQLRNVQDECQRIFDEAA